MNIVLNLKKKREHLTFFDGNIMIGDTEVIHPKLNQIGGKKVPTIKHGTTLLSGATDCIEYIDKTFGEKRDILYPREPTNANKTIYCSFFVDMTFR